MSASGVNKDLREKRRALKAAMAEERKQAKTARDEEKQEENRNALRVKILHHYYLRHKALQALQVNTKSTSSSPHTDG